MNNSGGTGIAVVGLRFGRIIVEELLDKEVRGLFELKGVCDLERERAEEVGREYGVRVIPGLDDILADPAIPAVALMTPPFGRASLIRKALAAGKHVMTTKPFEMDSGEAGKVLQEAVRKKLTVHLNSPTVKRTRTEERIRMWQREFDLGSLVGVRADMVAKKARRPQITWYDDPARCPVAPVFRIGIYLINEILNLTGPAEKVSVLSSRFCPTDRATADNAQLSFLFKSGAIGNVFVSFCVDDGFDHRHMVTLNFERGTIYKNVGPVTPGCPADSDELALVRRSEIKWEPTVTRMTVPRDDRYDWRTFHDAILGKDAAGDDFRERIVNGVKVLEAMARAEKSGKIETVD